MISPELQAFFRRIVERLMRPLLATGLTPNQLTFIGFLLSAVTAGVLATGQFIAGGLLVLFSGAFDMLDGGLARIRGGGTKFGAFFDSTLDRLSEGMIYLGLLVWFQLRQHTTAVIIVYAVILGSLLISYARARAEGLGLECKVGLLARPERVLLLGGALLLDGFGVASAPADRDRLLVVVLGGVAVLTFFTLAQRIWHIWLLTLPPQQAERSVLASFWTRVSDRRARHL
ncbi:MAG: CDP-alcohol phosphatidyltransferase family protein [Chloroflexi bacterium]|nr:CDP-alcohol phosphatidyltransferase family protein [Chloroflexota bacterium]